ncbi:hypothetical protein YC2023_043130 [Brassica napus]
MRCGSTQIKFDSGCVLYYPSSFGPSSCMGGILIGSVLFLFLSAPRIGSRSRVRVFFSTVDTVEASNSNYMFVRLISFARAL